MSAKDFFKAPDLKNPLNIAALNSPQTGLKIKGSMVSIDAINNNFKKYVDIKSLPYTKQAVIYYILDVEKALYSSGLMTLLWSEAAIKLKLSGPKKGELEQEHIRERHLLWAEIIEGVHHEKCIVSLIQARDRCAILSEAEHDSLAARKERTLHEQNPVKLHLSNGITFCKPVWSVKRELVGGEALSSPGVLKWFE